MARSHSIIFETSLRPAISQGKARRSGNALGAKQAASSGGKGSIAADQKTLPPIPELRDLASDRLVHNYRELFNPPEAMNEWGRLTVGKSVSGMIGVSFPPYACCGIPQIPFGPGNLTTCELFLNDRLLYSYPSPGDQIAYTWYPHRVLREAEVEGLRFTTKTFMPSKQRAAAESLEVKNESGEARKVLLGFDLRAGVTVKDESWYVDSPAEGDNRLTPDEARGCVVFEARTARPFPSKGFIPGRSESSRSASWSMISF